MQIEHFAADNICTRERRPVAKSWQTVAECKKNRQAKMVAILWSISEGKNGAKIFQIMDFCISMFKKPTQVILHRIIFLREILFLFVLAFFNRRSFKRYICTKYFHKASGEHRLLKIKLCLLWNNGSRNKQHFEGKKVTANV